MSWKFPWTKRADNEQRLRQQAERRLQNVQADWPRVHRETARLDAFNTTARHLFGGDKR